MSLKDDYRRKYGKNFDGKNFDVKTKNVQAVNVIDFDMEFGSMVFFMVKWAIASIPAMMIIIFILYASAVTLGLIVK